MPTPRPLAACVAVLVWLLGLAAAAPPAIAHAVLVEAVPADGASLANAPDSLRLRFNEPVSLTVVRLLDEDGSKIPTEAAAEGEWITVRPTLPLGQGGYLLSY